MAARDSDVDITFDDDALNPHFSYLDESSLRHDVWFLDAVTALNHMRAAQMLGIKTFALWRLGGEDRTIWRVWDIPGDPGIGRETQERSSRAGCGYGGSGRDPAH